MAYREDKDLEFLGELKSQDLNELVELLTKDKDGDSRWTEELTGHKEYKQHYPKHAKYWQLIAAELQCFGANSFATVFRGGKGVFYKEILEEVCDKLKVDYSNKDTIEAKEDKVILKILEKSIFNMSEAEKQSFAKLLGLENTKLFAPEALMAAAQTAFKLGGFKSYQLTLIVVNAISKAVLGRGLAFAGNAALARTLSVWAGPIGWTVTGLWTLVDIAGPAYRVTIPSTIQIAYLRKKYITEKNEILEEIYKEMENSLEV